ncbi:MAG: glycosyltransferase [Proteobacteria bacterium]|nr:glycosyltransferase [Pseudomonadota bacterium]
MLDDCLRSVYSQIGGLDVEVIVHDDASTDGSLGLLAKNHPQVRVITSTENVGFCVANNRMADAARENYLLLNNDAALDTDALQTLLSEAIRIGGDAILTLPQRDWETGIEVDRGCFLDVFNNPVPNASPLRADVAYVVGACLWIPRALWHVLGGFPAWFGSLAEDAYLCCAARLRGIPVRCLTDSGYRHRQGASFGGNRVSAGKLQTTIRRRFLSERNKVAILVVCMPTFFVWGLLAIHVALLLVEGVLMSLLRMDAGIFGKIYGPVLVYACRAPFTLRQFRNEMQAKRCVSLREYLRTFTWMPRKLSLLWRHGVPEVR